MLPAAAILMLHLAIGPFGHPSLLHWHQSFTRIGVLWRTSLVFLAIFTLLIGTLHLLGWLPAQA